MHVVRFSPALVSAALVLSGSVDAQTTPAFTTTSKAPQTKVVAIRKTTKTNVPVQRSAKSLDCSKQADAKGLHGTARKHFMSTCKKA